MKARDVMVSPVITVNPNSSIREVAKKLLENRISAVPMVDDGGKLVGMISEGDLMHRSEAGTERQRSWWLRLMAGDDMLAADYAKAHGRKVVDVMTQNVITASANIVRTPSPTKAWAMARPMPFPAPVTSAALRDGSNGLFKMLIFVNPTDVVRTVACCRWNELSRRLKNGMPLPI